MEKTDILIIGGSAANANSFFGNNNFGVFSDGTTEPVNATYNYWGAPDGPSGVGPGSGDAVSENVTFEPWLNTNPYNMAPVVGDIPDQCVPAGDDFSTLSLDDYVEDGDNDDEEITWDATGNMDLTVDIDDARVATVTYAEGWTGSEVVTF